MAKPPESPASSDIEGVNRDARVGVPSRSPQPDPGGAIDHAKDQSTARPEGSEPSSRKGG